MAEKQQSSNKSSDQWVSDILNEARNSNPSISDGVWAAMEFHLKGQMSERDLTPASLKALAVLLITDMAPTPPQPEETA